MEPVRKTCLVGWHNGPQLPVPIGQPDVLLLDEPFSALDAFTKMQLQDLLLKIQKKRLTTMVVVTHDIDEAPLLM